ncbi:hypothetical protein C6497_13305 [Candidatus Poribacteria bacterium]|nr:MAG: hypothetical protein C6497_13305 [Candidatus Poribacteria bacterium]
MSNDREIRTEIRKIVRMLEATTKFLEKPSVLDNFSDGENRCILQFNNALERLYELEALPDGFFQPLDSSASVGDIGYAYHQVATYLKEGTGIEFDFDIREAKKTIGDEMRNFGDMFTRSFFSDKDRTTSADGPESVEIEDGDDITVDSVEPRLDKLEEQMETVVEILQELRSKKDKKDDKKKE